MFNQRGHCKFGEKCRKHHNNSICSNGLICHQESCTSRHLKRCRYFALDGFCKFGDSCSFLHSTSVYQSGESDIRDLVSQLGLLRATIEEMSHKIDNLELELIEVKKECSSSSNSTFSCDQCDFKSNITPTLVSHIISKHPVKSKQLQVLTQDFAILHKNIEKNDESINANFEVIFAALETLKLHITNTHQDS